MRTTRQMYELIEAACVAQSLVPAPMQLARGMPEPPATIDEGGSRTYRIVPQSPDSDRAPTCIEYTRSWLVVIASLIKHEGEQATLEPLLDLEDVLFDAFGAIEEVATLSVEYTQTEDRKHIEATWDLGTSYTRTPGTSGE